jgi:hypothetical protein
VLEAAEEFLHRSHPFLELGGRLLPDELVRAGELEFSVGLDQQDDVGRVDRRVRSTDVT